MNKSEQKIKHSRVLELFKYNKKTGWFTRRSDWLLATGGVKAKKGDRAGSLKKETGYRRIYIDGHYFMEHRLAIFYVTGKWPSKFVDHVNGVRDDNSYTNLREASRVENCRNTDGKSHRKSKYRGVHFVTGTRSSWRASINVNGRKINLGCHPSEKLAHAARRSAELIYFREFARG